jgi:hypothetical protein
VCSLFFSYPCPQVYAQAAGSEPAALAEALAALRVTLTPAELRQDVAPLVRLVMARLLSRSRPAAAPLLDACSRLPGPAPEPEGEGLRVAVAKCIHRPGDPSSFDAWGRVLSGVLRDGDMVKV